jgi:hypothetical protein
MFDQLASGFCSARVSDVFCSFELICCSERGIAEQISHQAKKRLIE